MKLTHALHMVMIYHVRSLTSCFFIIRCFMHQKNILKDDSQPCISTPVNETRFKRNKQFKIMRTYVFVIAI